MAIPNDDMPDPTTLAPTPLIDNGHPAVVAFARRSRGGDSLYRPFDRGGRQPAWTPQAIKGARFDVDVARGTS